MRIWGYWATFGWAFLAFIAGQFGAFAIILLLHVGNISEVLASPFDGGKVTLFIIISNPITIALVALAVWIARAPQAEYLALKLPVARDVWVGLICIAGLIVLSDVLLYLGGYELVTPFQAQAYASAAAEGWLVPLLIAAIIVAPAGEEILFRGFLFRGWVRSDRTAWLAIAVISILWAALHVQYDWTGILQIFVVGLFLGWLRWRSGSTLLTFLLHALFNLEASVETALQIQFFS